MKFCPHCGARLAADVAKPALPPALAKERAMKRRLTSVKDFAAEGPFSENSLRWFVFNSAANGLDKSGAIVRVGRRVYLDADAFEQWIQRGCK